MNQRQALTEALTSLKARCVSTPATVATDTDIHRFYHKVEPSDKIGRLSTVLVGTQTDEAPKEKRITRTAPKDQNAGKWSVRHLRAEIICLEKR